MNVLSLNQDTFDTAIRGTSLPVLVDFWADWCGPCRSFALVLDQLADEHLGKVLVAKVNVDDSPDLADRFGITAIPTLILFRNGRPEQILRGAPSKPVLGALLAAA